MRKLTLLFLFISSFAFGQGILSPPSVSLNTFNKAAYNRPKNRQLWVSGHNYSPWTMVTDATTMQGGTSRLTHKIFGPASLISFVFANSVNGSGGFEGVSSGSQLINSASLEWPAGTVSVPSKVSVGGSALFQSDFGGMSVETDPIGTYIPAGSTITYRVFNRVAFPPTSPSATLTAGGSLTVATPYYYFITSIDKFRNIESVVTSSVTATPTSGNQAITLSWTRNQYALSYNIYRSTTNTAASATLLANVPVTATTYTDNGTVTPMSTNVAPTVNNFLVLNRILRNGESNDLPLYGGTGTDRTGTNGALSVPGNDNLSVYGYGAGIVLTDDYSKPSILCLGTSIPNGGGIISFVGGVNRAVSNWFDRAIGIADNVNSLNLSVSSSTLQDLTGQTTKNARYRLAWARYVNYVWVPQGVNDMPTRTWQQIATDANNLATQITANGSRYILNTIAPYVTTTDNCLTVTNQAVSANEAVRLNYNAWARNGCRFSGSTPVLTGGTPSPYIWKVYDECTAVEVNASNVLTLNGGFYRVPTSALVSSITLTGTQTLTALAATGVTWTNSQFNGYVVKVVTGAAAGQQALIQGTGATTLALYANGSTVASITTNKGLTTIPSAGDTIEIWAVNTYDGLHPNQEGSYKIAVDAAAFITTNVKQYAQ